MNLNLGLESLNGSVGVRYPNTENNSNLFNACDSVLGDMITSITNYFDAAQNAVAVRKALKKYGRTQSIIALVGQEGLYAAETFSMEGFWQQAKELLVKIWEKICEWWNRFWSIFFSNQKKMENLAKEKGTLVRPVEYDGVDIDSFEKALEFMKKNVKSIVVKVDSIDMKAGTYVDPKEVKMAGNRLLYADINNAPKHELKRDVHQTSSITGEHDADRGIQLGLRFIHVNLTDAQKVRDRAKLLAKILKECTKLQTSIDKTSKKALTAAKKISDTNNSRQSIDDSKLAAKMMRSQVQQYYKAANTEASKLAAHASFTGK